MRRAPSLSSRWRQGPEPAGSGSSLRRCWHSGRPRPGAGRRRRVRRCRSRRVRGPCSLPSSPQIAWAFLQRRQRRRLNHGSELVRRAPTRRHALAIRQQLTFRPRRLVPVVQGCLRDSFLFSQLPDRLVVRRKHFLQDRFLPLTQIAHLVALSCPF
jgi:hypothetical protein